MAAEASLDREGAREIVASDGSKPIIARSGPPSSQPSRSPAVLATNGRGDEGNAKPLLVANLDASDTSVRLDKTGGARPGVAALDLGAALQRAVIRHRRASAG